MQRKLSMKLTLLYNINPGTPNRSSKFTAIQYAHIIYMFEFRARTSSDICTTSNIVKMNRCLPFRMLQTKMCVLYCLNPQKLAFLFYIVKIFTLSTGKQPAERLSLKKLLQHAKNHAKIYLRRIIF